MKQINRMIVIFAAVLLLASCARPGPELMTLNKRPSVGSPFTRYMAQEYRDLANTMQRYMFGKNESKLFAKKGLASTEGVIVMPEVPNDWSLSDRDIVEMTTARATLIQTLDNGGRDLTPAEAAIAQSRFDCWVVEQTKNWNADVVCKRQFKNALRLMQAELSTKLSASPFTTAPAPIQSSASSTGYNNAGHTANANDYDGQGFPAPIGMGGGAGANTGTYGAGGTGTYSNASAVPTPTRQAMFLVFFDWDKSSLTLEAHSVIDAVAAELKSRGDIDHITVSGHSDTSGNERYNQTLSLRRAQSVRDALIQRGIDGNKISAIGMGERDPLVPTADGVREPANRRAEITIQ